MMTLSFSILFNFEIDNERNGMVICQCLTLIDNIESFLLIKNPIKSEEWLLFDYDEVSCTILENKIYWWNIWHVTLFYKDNKIKRVNE